MNSRILITPGEPAGIGPDLTVRLAQEASVYERVIVADPDLIESRAKRLNLPIKLTPVNWQRPPQPQSPGVLSILPIQCETSVVPGTLNPNNSTYVLNTLTAASDHCLKKALPYHQTLVTGPVHKGVLNEAGIAFTGHTEFFQQQANSAQVVMLMVAPQLKVALTTTHLPLKSVADAITPQLLTKVINTLHSGLKDWFQIPNPNIGVCGLNPHAGENGHLGTEELEVIIPVLQHLRHQGLHLTGPLPADTIFIAEQFSAKQHSAFDVILAMYHDQGLPVIKQMAFDQTVNVTLGLPYLRTSVDHGTALPLAVTAELAASANPNSFIAAIRLAASAQSLHTRQHTL